MIFFQYWIWAYWIAYLHYALEGLFINQFDGQDYYCMEDEGAVAVPIDGTNQVRYYCPLENGEDVLDKYDMDQPWLIPDICILLVFFVILLTLSIIVMKKYKHIKR